jgi:hypothetical protein
MMTSGGTRNQQTVWEQVTDSRAIASHSPSPRRKPAALATVVLGGVGVALLVVGMIVSKGHWGFLTSLLVYVHCDAVLLFAALTLGSYTVPSGKARNTRNGPV